MVLGFIYYPNTFQDSTCNCFSHLQRQKSRIQRKLFFQSCLQDPHEACFALLSGDEFCPVRAKIHHSDFQSLVCSHPSLGRNQPNRPVSFGTLSTPHRPIFGHNKHRRHQCCRGQWNRHHCFACQLCRVHHSSCKLLRMKSLFEIVFRDRLSKLKVLLAIRTYTGFCVVPLVFFRCGIRIERRKREMFCHLRSIAMLKSAAKITDTKDKIVSYYLVLR